MSKKFLAQKTTIGVLALILVFTFCLAPVALASYEDDWDEFMDDEGEGGVWSQMTNGGLNTVGEYAYGEQAEDINLPNKVASMVKAFLSILGIVFLIITVYAGFRWMTAGGNEEQVTEAKKLLRNGIIGLAIIVCAWTITLFVGEVLTRG